LFYVFIVMNFPYNLNSIKDCINDTEVQLRDLISNVLSSNNGIKWDTSSVGFSPDIINELKRRIKQAEGIFPNQTISSRLLDYSDIIHLKYVIEKNWIDFEPIFHSKDKTLIYFDQLQYLRNPIFHGRPGILDHQKLLVLGICGEFILAIHNWEKGMTLEPNSFHVGLRIKSDCSKRLNSEDGELETKALAEKWLEMVKDKSHAKFEIKEDTDDYVTGLLNVPHGHLRISYSWKHIGNEEKKIFRYVNLTIETDNPKGLDEAIIAGKYPYYYIRYLFKKNIDVSIIHEIIKNQAGRTPVGTGHVTNRDGQVILTNIEYNPLDNLRITVDRGSSCDGTITLSYDFGYDKGFWMAHLYLSPKKLLSFLYGELAQIEFNRLLQEAITPLG